MFALYHHFGEMYLNSREGRERQGPEVGTRARQQRLETVSGEQRVLPAPGAATMLTFMSTDCTLCKRIKPTLAQVAAEVEEVELVVLCAGAPDEVREWAHGLGDVAVFPDPAHRVAARYRIGMTPFLVGVDADGIVRARGLFNDEQGLVMAAREVLAAAEEEADQTVPLAAEPRRHVRLSQEEAIR
jgi:thiol-disulfide isomerase/thioredoxin